MQGQPAQYAADAGHPVTSADPVGGLQGVNGQQVAPPSLATDGRKSNLAGCLHVVLLLSISLYHHPSMPPHPQVLPSAQYIAPADRHKVVVSTDGGPTSPRGR